MREVLKQTRLVGPEHRFIAAQTAYQECLLVALPSMNDRDLAYVAWRWEFAMGFFPRGASQ